MAAHKTCVPTAIWCSAYLTHIAIRCYFTRRVSTLSIRGMRGRRVVQGAAGKRAAHITCVAPSHGRRDALGARAATA